MFLLYNFIFIYTIKIMETYNINEVQVKAINVLIRTLQEAINRKTFTEKEVKGIVKTIDKLNSF